MTGRLERVGAGLRSVRERPWHRRAAIAAGAVLGLAAGSLHWVGLLVGGAAVGLPSRDLKWATAAGAGFGLLAWAVFAVTVSMASSVATVAATGQLVAVSAALAVVTGLLGSLARGLV